MRILVGLRLKPLNTSIYLEDTSSFKHPWLSGIVKFKFTLRRVKVKGLMRQHNTVSWAILIVIVI